MSSPEYDDPDTKITQVPSDKASRMDVSTKDAGVKAKRSSTMGPQTLALNTHKAGMEGLDADKINEIIKKASQGSKFYQHKQKCQQRLDAKISEMMKAKESFSEQQINKATLQMDRLIDELELERDLSHKIVHVDMDMFYAAVEMRDDPSLRDKPMAVGSTGMLSTSNYAARKFGVRAAMPGFIGKKLCPDLIIVPPNFTKYKECSKAVQGIFAEYDPNFSPMSLDEAFLDITQYIKKNAHLYVEDADDDVDDGYVAECIVREMREKIQTKTQLTASAGIASNTRLAKVCSDLNKPNGQLYLPPNKQKILEFVSSLPIRKVSGIGNVTEQQLSALGIKVCSDLLKKRGLLRLLYTDLNYDSFVSIALGLGSTSLEAWTERDRKSISTETTFRGSSDKGFHFQQTEELCHELAEDLVEKDIYGKIFTLKIKTTDFKLKTKAHSFLEATRSRDALVSAARRLLQHEMDASSQPLSLRLIGVRMSSLVNASEMGSSRQVTLTDLFSKAGQTKSQLFVKPSDSASSSTQKTESKPEFKSEIVKGKSAGNGQGEDFLESYAVAHKDNNVISKKEQSASSSIKSSCIDNFFSRSTRKSDAPKTLNYECPVCFEQIQVTSINKFNVHVDNCLNFSMAKGSSLPCENDNKHLLEKGDIRAHQPITEEVNSSWRGERSLVNKSGEQSKEKDYADVCCDHPSEKKTPANIKKQETFLCPVCKKAGFTDINLLNNHIDECLNTGIINKIMDRQESLPNTQNPRQQKDAGCSFFGTLQSTSTKREVMRDASQPRKKQKTCRNTLEKYFTS